MRCLVLAEQSWSGAMGVRARREQVQSYRSSQQPGFSLKIQLPSRSVSRLLGMWFCVWVGVNNSCHAGQAKRPPEHPFA